MPEILAGTLEIHGTPVDLHTMPPPVKVLKEATLDMVNVRRFEVGAGRLILAAIVIEQRDTDLCRHWPSCRWICSR